MTSQLPGRPPVLHAGFRQPFRSPPDKFGRRSTAPIVSRLTFAAAFEDEKNFPVSRRKERRSAFNGRMQSNARHERKNHMKIKSGRACAVFAATLFFAVAADAAPRGDSDGDGKLTLAEFQTMTKERLMRADASADDRISFEEWKARPASAKAKGDPSRIFRRIDANGDGFVDAAEVDSVLKRRFDRIDANADGAISQEELSARRAAAEN
jgi:Ca2+-binding EF-hand superfamily protein